MSKRVIDLTAKELDKLARRAWTAAAEEALAKNLPVTGSRNGRRLQYFRDGRVEDLGPVASLSKNAAKIAKKESAHRVLESELIQRVAAQNLDLYTRDIQKIVDAVLGEITAALARGDRVELRGFGAFSVKHRASRSERNPRTGRVSRREKLVPDVSRDDARIGTKRPSR